MPRLRCSCPCNRYTPKLQGIQELEDAGFRLVRCQCQHCGGGGRRGCHHLVPPRIHHRTRGLCWLCVGLDHPHVAGLLDDAEETDESPHDPTSFGLDSSIPGSRPSIISQAAPLASSWDWRAELGLSHAPPLASVPAPALPQQAESPPDAAFARQRAAAIEAVVRAEPKAQSEVRLRHELAVVATAVAAEALAASAGAGEKVRKRAADKATSFREAEMQAKKARTKIINKINVCVAIGSSLLAQPGRQNTHCCMTKPHGSEEWRLKKLVGGRRGRRLSQAVRRAWWSWLAAA